MVVTSRRKLEAFLASSLPLLELSLLLSWLQTTAMFPKYLFTALAKFAAPKISFNLSTDFLLVYVVTRPVSWI